MSESMPLEAQKPWMMWTGRVLSALPVLLMLFSGGMKISHNPGVVQNFAAFGIPEAMILPIGLIEVGCVVVYLIPPTAVLGAVLIAGYLGGAVLTHWRVGQGPVAFAPLLLGGFAWAGLWLREPRLRELLPLRRS
jgi:hypothetical protein